jgi:hypothetical protein
MVLLGSILLAGQSPATRALGFLCMILANGFFFLYGVQVVSTALMLSSVVFMVVNIYGIARNLLSLKGKE